MQEEVENRTVTLVISATKLTGRVLKAAVAKFLAHQNAKIAEKKRAGPVKPTGKQTVKQLVGQNQGVANIEISDKNIKDFDRVARKYGVDYAVKKDKTLSPPKYMVFFKARDADALTAAFEEYTRNTARKRQKPSLIQHLHDIQAARKLRFIGNFYDAEEVNKLFEVSKGTKLEFPILFGAFYGLRRSEALGLKWDAIDFENDSITIRHTVTSVTLDGKVQLVAADTTKTKSSLRTLPLVPFVKERLLVLKKEQENNRRLCGRSYHKQFAGYVCINEMGDLIKPHYVTEQFPKLLDANGLRRIRFHDLRHSCASLMLANGVPMKQIQDWLGHSDFSTTANIYAHLDYSTKLSSADAMLSGLGFQTEKA